jgi:hypothetical protein
MEQRDYIQKQIDQLERVLAKLLSSLLNLKSQGKINKAMKMVDQNLKKELDLDVQAIMAIPTENLIEILKDKKNLNIENLGSLADILFLLGASHPAKGAKSEILFKQCLTIFEYLEKLETTYSFERHQRMEHIKTMLF